MTKGLDEMRAKMERSAAALAQFEKELNVIDPEQKTSIISSRLVQLTADYTTAQSDRAKAEAIAKSVRSGNLEGVEGSIEGEQYRKLEDHLNEEREKFDQVKTQYGPNHPEYKKAVNHVAELQRQFETLKAEIAQRVEVEYRQAVSREQLLQQNLNEAKAEFDSLNARSLEYKSLKRDADADKTVYEELTKRINEASINSGFTGSSIRLADLARAGLSPYSPERD